MVYGGGLEIARQSSHPVPSYLVRYCPVEAIRIYSRHFVPSRDASSQQVRDHLVTIPC